MPREVETRRNNAYSEQLKNYLTSYLVDQYEERSGKLWNRDYSNMDAFKRSVEPNRRRLEELVGAPALRQTGPVKKHAHAYLKSLQTEWVELPLGLITAEGLLVFPKGATQEKPAPLIIVQHGLDGFPESAFEGYNKNYNAYASELVKAGFAVLAPMNLWVEKHRNHIERFCRLAGCSLLGVEFNRMQKLLDIVLADPRIDRERVGMWGISLGGLATMFSMPLEPRIKVGIVSAWFNHRRNKMTIPDDRYTSFMPTTEEHAFLNGWLTEFSDDDVVSLICPRPLLIQHGKKDRIAYPPHMLEEFKKARYHYEKLGITDMIQMDLHEGYHEAVIDSGVKFMVKWLNGENSAPGRP